MAIQISWSHQDLYKYVYQPLTEVKLRELTFFRSSSVDMDRSKKEGSKEKTTSKPNPW